MTQQENLLRHAPCRVQDKLQGFWDITKARLEERTDELAAKDQEIESLQDRHHLELKVLPW